jgi:hypothetical protein
MKLEFGSFESKVPYLSAEADGPRMHQDRADRNLANRVANLIGLFGVHGGGVISTYVLARWAAIFNLLY